MNNTKYHLTIRKSYSPVHVMKKLLLLLLLCTAMHGQAQWIWKNDSLKRSDVIQLSAGYSYGAFDLSQNNSSINYLKYNGWERGFRAQLHAKLSPALSIIFGWQSLEQGIMMYYSHPDFYESYYLLNKRKSISSSIAFTARSKKKKDLFSLYAGVSFNKMDFSIPLIDHFYLNPPYEINNTGAFILDFLPYSNHSFLMGISKGVPLGAGFSLHTFAEAEYTPKFAILDYTYRNTGVSPVITKTTIFTFSSIQTRLGVSVKW